MPDAFFSSTKPRKRKRTQSVGGADKSSRPAKKQAKPDAHSKGKRVNGPSKVNGSKKKRQDEELHSDQTDESDGGGIDDMDLRAASEEAGSGDEYADETPADKRLRLAGLYLESVKEGLGECSLVSYNSH